MRIAFLEDDPPQLELMLCWGEDAGYHCYGFRTGRALTDALSKDTFDLLVIDWNLPDTTGIEIVRWVRDTMDWQIPVLFITGRGLEEDAVIALDAGADDYTTKPVQRMAVLAQLQALNRRAIAKTASDVIDLASPYAIDTASRQIKLNGEVVELTNKEYELAALLFHNVGRRLSRSYMMEMVWGTRAELNTRTVDTHISRIRNKLAIRSENGWRLMSVYYHGYRLENIG